MFQSSGPWTHLLRLTLVALVAAAAHGSTIFTPNSWELDVNGNSNGFDQNGFSTFVTLSDTSNTFLNPRKSIGVSTECGGQSCSGTGDSAMGAFSATANLNTFSIGVQITPGGSFPQDVNEAAAAQMQINIPLIGTIAPGGQEAGSVSMTVHGSGVGDNVFDSQPNSGASLLIGASLITCTYDMAAHNTLGDDCFAPSASAQWTSKPQNCDVDGEVQPGCYPLGALPGVLSSDFLVYSDYTILHLAIGIGAQGFDDASADLSHTASFTITPPPGFTVDYSAFSVANTTSAPEPSTYGFVMAGVGVLLFFARRKSSSTRRMLN